MNATAWWVLPVGFTNRVAPAAWLALALVSVAATARAGELNWPSGRSAHAMVYDDRLERVAMFGGMSRGGDDVDVLWCWDGNSWTQTATDGPGERAHFAFAYDAARDEVVVHGGFRAEGRVITERFGDTWVWGARGWRRATANGPGVRDHHAMVFDAARERVVLFGGGDSTGTMLGDTWEWDGSAWSMADTAGPAPRTTHRMVYDTVRRGVLLFGGWGDGGLLGDTWMRDGEGWRRLRGGGSAGGGSAGGEAVENGPAGTAPAEVADVGPSPRFATRWAFDSTRGEAVLFGGRDSGGDLADTWIWNGRAWHEALVDGPSARNVHAMAYDTRRRRVVLFGGYHRPDVYADVWEWDGVEWREIAQP